MDESKHGASSLEPRVATLETELRQVLKAVGELVKSGERVETQIQSLALALERAAAPKQANWFAIMATGTSFVLLLITIGALVLSPMIRTETDLTHWRDEHVKLELHPVGKSRIDALEKSVLERAAINAAGIRDLDIKLQKEYQLMDASVRERVGAVEREVRERWVYDSAGLVKISDETAQTVNRITVLETLMRNGVNNEK